MNSSGNKNIRAGKIMLIVSICMPLIIIYASIFNVYDYALIGAVYELVWLPLIGMLFILPVITFIYWSKDKFRFMSVYPVILLNCIISIWLLFSFNNSK
jgi:hypothetical protein